VGVLLLQAQAVTAAAVAAVTTTQWRQVTRRRRRMLMSLFLPQGGRAIAGATARDNMGRNSQ
jgi:hypothetical protein